MVRVSNRGRGVVAFSYDDFPLGCGESDLRGDNSAPLTPAGAALAHMPLRADDIAGYGPIDGMPELRAAVANIFDVPTPHVLITTGASEALHLAFTCAADTGQSVRLPQPAFPGFDQLAALAGLQIRHYPVPGPGVFPAAHSDSALTVVCTPHNPTGVITAYSAPQDSASWRVWDISHTSLYGSDADDFRGRLAHDDIIICSLSKLLRLPGARVGFMIVPSPGLRDAIVAAKTHISMSTSRLSQVLALTVLQDPATAHELKDRQQHLTDLRERLQSAVAASTRLTAVPAGGGSHLLVEDREGHDPWQVLKEVGVVGLPGVVFGARTSCVRLCAAQPAAVIDVAAGRIQSL